MNLGETAEHTERLKAAKAVHQAYLKRIEDLKSDAALDSFSLNEASERDFWSFIKTSPFIKKGQLFLMGELPLPSGGGSSLFKKRKE